MAEDGKTKREGGGKRWRRRAALVAGFTCLFVVGLMAAGAAAEGNPLDTVTALTSLISDSSSTDTTSTPATSTDTSSSSTDTTSSSTDTSSSSTDTSSSSTDTSSSSTETTTTAAPAPVPYIVTFNSGISDAQQQADIAAANGAPGDAIAPLDMYSLTFPAGEDTTDAQTLAANPDVASVTPDLSRETATAPNDPQYPNQWSLPQIGWDNVYGTIDPGSTATVAILDTGVDASQPDLQGVVVPGTDIVDGTGDGTSDPNGHGTEMAGIVAAATDNNVGIAGVGYSGVKIMPVTVLGADGTGLDSDVINGVVWATQHGANVILMSFSNPGFSPALQDAINWAWSQGVVIVAAVGNDGSSTVNYPAGDQGVVGVGSTGIGDVPSTFSNTGPDVFMAAPGENILTTDTSGDYTSVTGTSTSAAEVAGAAALMEAYSPMASNGVIVNRLAESADPAGTSDQTGNGRLNLDRAINDTSDASTEPAGAPPVGDGGPFVGPYVAAASNLNVTFSGSGGGSITVSVPAGQSINYPTTGSGACTGATGDGTNSVTIVGSCNLNITGNGTTASVSATPNASSTFGGWSPTVGTCTGTTNPCSTGALGGGQTSLGATFNSRHTTTTAVSCLPSSVAVNATTVCTATATDTSGTGATTPSGTVSGWATSVASGGIFFTHNTTTPSTSCTLSGSGNTATCQLDFVPALGKEGTQNITASYGGDSGHSSSNNNGSPFVLTVTKRNTSTAVNCVPSSVAVATSSTCTATVGDTSSGTSVTATGSVSFSSSGSGTFTPTSCTLSSGSCSVTYTPSAVGTGTHNITGSYGGDTDHGTSNNNTTPFGLTVHTRTTSTSVTGCSPTSVAINGSATTCTVVVTDTDSGTKSAPGGTVSFTTSGTGNFSGSPCTLTPGTTTSSCTVTYTATAGAGTHTIKASYTPNDSVHAASSDTNGFGETVTTRTTSTSVTGCSPTSVAINGSATTCTVVVTDTDSGTKSAPGGTVSFTTSGTGNFSGSPCTLTPGTTTSSCTVTYTATAGAGTHTIKASYTPNDSVHAASSDTNGFGETVTTRTTSTSVTGCSPTSVAINGSATTCTVVVTDTDSGTKSAPGGTVSFTTSGTGNFSGSPCTLTPGTTTSSCTVTYTATAGAGTHTIKASYTPNDSVHAASSDTNGFGETVTTRTTTTGVSCASPVALNQGSLCTATVTDTDQGTKSSPTGSVSFSLDGAGSVSGAAGGFDNGSCSLASNGDGKSSSCSVTYTPSAAAGSHQIDASYGGTSLHQTSSGNTTITVTKRTTTTGVSCASPVALNQGSLCTATVTDTDQGTKSSPTGSVSFSLDGAGSVSGAAGGFDNGSCSLASNGDGKSSSCSVTYTPSAAAGSHQIDASYGGTSLHQTSSGNTTITVTKRTTTTGVSCASPVALNQGSLCTATVTDTDQGTKSSPTGSVSFSLDGAGSVSGAAGGFDNGSCSLASNGDGKSSSCSVTYTPSAAAGSHQIDASYGGTSLHQTSSGNTTITVTKRTTTTGVSCASPVALNQGSLCTATVTDTDQGTKSSPTGSVSFSLDGAGSVSGAAGGFDNGSCSLASNGDGKSSSCSVTYTPSAAAGSHQIDASYGGTSLHQTSSGNTTITVTKRTTTTGVSCASPVALNQGSLCTATVTDTDQGTKSSPTGSVSFSLDGAGSVSGAAGGFDNGSCSLASNGDGKSSSCSVTYTPSAAAGSHQIDASYGGTSLHQTSSGNTTITVTKRTTTTGVSCASPVALNQGSLCTATVTDTDQGTKSSPTGSVSFSLDGAGSVSGAAGGFDNGSCSLASNGDGKSSSCSVTYTPSAAAGSHQIDASYGGTSLHQTSSGNTTITVTKRTTTTGVSCASPVALNQGSLCTATVTDTDQGTKSSPTGSVSFSLDGAGSVSGAAGGFDNGSCSLASNGDGKSSSCSVTYTPSAAAGSHQIDASYGGTSLHQTSSGNTTITVTKRTTTTGVSCASPVALNQGSLCTATVTDTDQGTKSSPTGSVSFSLDGAGSVSGAAGGFDNGSCSLASNGDGKSSSCSVTYTPSAAAGSHQIDASYGGTSLHQTSSGNTTITVTKRTTTTGVSCASPVALNQGSLCTATVTDTDQGTKSSPTGSVSFSLDGAGSVSGAAGGFDNGSCSLASNGDGKSSSCSVTYTPSAAAGSHQIDASYGGTSLHQTSSGNTTITVTKRTTTTGVSCASPVALNQGSLCTATVTDTDQGTKSSPTGSVSFSLDGAGSVSGAAGGFDNGSCSLASNGDGKSSSCSVTYTPSAAAGSHQIDASYGGTSLHQTSSGNTTITVTKRTTTTGVSCASPVALNQGSLCTATVTDTDQGTKSSPTGSVSFSLDGAGSVSGAAGGFDNGSCSLASNGDGKSSSCSVTYTPSAAAGSHQIDASYGGTSLHQTSSGNTTITVTKRTTTTGVSCASPVALNQGSLCTATVTDTDQGTKSSPTGSVSFSLDGAGSVSGAAGGFDNGSCSLASNGDGKSSSCSVTYTPSAAAGSHQIDASYGGTSLHQTSSGNTTITVTKRAVSVSTACSPTSATINGTGTTCTATVTDTDGGTPSWPQGSVALSSTGAGTFSPAATCTLTQIASTASSSCSVTFTPTAYNSGSDTITSSYTATDNIHQNKTDASGFNLTVTKRAVSVSTACAPTSATINGTGTTCTATVTDTDGGTPSWPKGTVSFATTGAGGFSGSPCTLTQIASTASSSCSVTFTPTAYNSGSDTITSSYTATDNIHQNKTDASGFNLTVTKRAVSVSTACSPTSATINGTGTTCTATVTDTDGGTPSWPQGSVALSSTGAGTFSPAATCTLTQIASTASSSCSVTFTPTAYNSGSDTITSSYTATDNIHQNKTDASGFNLTVTKRAVSVSTACAPTSATINGTGTTCTATVTDTDGGTPSWPKGTVSFATTGAGGFSGSPCTLTQIASTASSSCSVTFTPTAYNSGSDTITSSYTATDNIHQNKTDASGFNLTVTKRAVSVSTACSPTSATINGTGTTCTATVTDTDGGTPSWPQGSVALSSTGAGTFSPAATCTLTQIASTASSSCSVTFTPTAYNSGSDTITSSYTATDNIHQNKTDASGFNLTVTKRTTSTKVSCSPSSVPLNQASTCTATVADTDSGTRSTPLGTVTFSSTATGTFSSTTCTLASSTSSSSTCSVGYTPTAIGATPHTITASYGGSTTHAASSDNVGVTITVTSVTVSPGTQQYSDPVTFTAVVSPSTAPATSVTFKVGTQTMGTVTLVSGGGVLTGTLTKALLEPTPFGTAPTGQMQPGSHTVTADFASASVANPTTSVTITQEDARSFYTGAGLFWTQSTSATNATVTLTATIKDITAVPSDGSSDSYPGDIRNASVSFVNRGTGGFLCSGLTPALVNSNDTTIGTVSCQVSLAAVSGNMSGTDYTIGIVVGTDSSGNRVGYYTDNSSGEDTVIEVAQPLASNFITGGGYLVNQSNGPGTYAGAGPYAGTPGMKTNFGFNVKYNKGGTNLQGHVNIIVRQGAKTYQIQSNSLTSLGVQYPTGTGCGTTATASCPITANFVSKANLNDITTGTPVPVTLNGPLTLTMSMTDHGSPGSADTLAVSLYCGNTLLYSSSWNSTSTVEVVLGGGDLVAH